MNNKPFFLLLLSIFSINILWANDTTGLKEIFISYRILNDNDPISNQKGYENRNRDDHGLTFNYTIHTGLKYQFNKNFTSKFNYQYYNGLYTKGFGTTTAIKPGNYDYDYFSYILKKHPDWQNIYLYDQTAITKTFHGFEINNNYKGLLFNFGYRAIEMNGGINQTGTQMQAAFHKMLNARNFYHKSFTDSTILKGNKVNFSSILLSLGYFKSLINNDLYTFNSSIQSGIWYNSISSFGIKQINPFAELNLQFQYGKSINESLRRLEVDYVLRYDPNERLPLFSDNGSRGYHGLSFSWNLSGLSSSKLSEAKKWCMVYALNFLSVYQPIAMQQDVMMNYISPAKDKQLITGFLNLSAKMILK